MTPNFPRVTLPGVSPEATAEVDALVEAARAEHLETVRARLVRSISLHRKGKHVFAHTVSPKTIARRRAASKVAKASRKANR